MQHDWHVPEIPYSPIDALNRRAAALGSPGYAQTTAYANYNGHSISVSWNDYRGYYITQYYYGERVVLARGDFASCLKAALREYERGALGCSVSIGLKDNDSEAEEICKSTEKVKSGKLSESDRSWYTWKHTCAARSARDSANPTALRMNFDWNLLLAAESEAQYERALTEKFGRAFTF
jgi:hypothetical protein